MTIHSVVALPSVSRRPRAEPAPGSKRDAILRAATDVFAGSGYFNAQVADVARVAGVAAGTVYLYFRSKDDLLVSIFERSMRDAITEGRAMAGGVRDPRERLRRFAALHLGRLGRDRKLAVVFQVELRQSTKFMERFTASWLGRYFDLVGSVIEQGQREGTLRADVPRKLVTKAFFGTLDELVTSWVIGRKDYDLALLAGPAVDLLLRGAAAANASAPGRRIFSVAARRGGR